MRLNGRGSTGTGTLWLRSEGFFTLSGTVKDCRGAPLAGALVTLASDPTIRALTGAKGVFTTCKPEFFDGRDPLTAGPKLAGFGLFGDRFHFFLPASAASGSIAFSSVDGKKRLELSLGPFGVGAHRVDLPELAPGAYSLRIVLGPFSGSAHLVQGGNGTTLMPRTCGSRHTSREARSHTLLSRQESPDVKDTLLVRKAGFVTAKRPLISHEQHGIEVVMARR